LNAQEKFELIARNSAELITEPEIRELIENKKNPITYCGYEPSGPIHLGHLVTINKLIDLGKAGFKVKVLLADYHGWLNKKGDWDFIESQAKIWMKGFQALGLKEAEFVLGSSFQRTKEYFDDLLKLSLHTTLNRALRSMQEIARDIENAHVSQTIYPLMQVADIKHLNVDLTEAGLEQRKIHMLARELMQEIEARKPLFVHTPLIDSLRGPGSKMSSSAPETMISVADTEQNIRNKINKAYCVEGEAKGNSLLEITELIIFPRKKIIEIERPQKFGGNISFSNFPELKREFEEKKLHPQDLKNAVAMELIGILEPARKAFKGVTA